MSNFSDFKNSLGIAREDFHKKRFNLFGIDVAFNDFFGSIFIALFFTILIGSLLYWKMKLHNLNFFNKLKYWLFIFVYFTIVTFLFGIIIHRIFSVNTELNKLIFGTI